MGFKLPMNLFSGDEETEGKELDRPVSLESQALSTSFLSLYVHVVFEFEEPIAEISEFLRYSKSLTDALSLRNPLISCIMKEDDRGVLRWQKTTLNIDDHIFIAELPPGEESYDSLVDDYISTLSLTPLDQSRPLWEAHLLNYKTSKAGATMVYKLHHSLGDGISFMSTFFSYVRRVDNPHLQPTFPTAKPTTRSSTRSKMSIAANFFRRFWYNMLVGWYTLVDVISCCLRTAGWIDDSQLPIRGPPGVEKMPIARSSATFHLEDIKQIKNYAGGTVNDVITGIIFYGIQRYLQIRLSTAGEHTSQQDASGKRLELPKAKVIERMNNLRVTAICWMNLRALAGVQNIDKMLKSEAQAIWGNHVGFLLLRLPVMGKVENPMEFVRMAKGSMDRHKMSLGTFINVKLLLLLRYVPGLKGLQATAKCLYNNIARTTMAISNMIGPMEKVAINGHAIKSFSFFVSGLPQALGLFVLSYAGDVVIQVQAQKACLDANMLSKCFMEAFEEIQNTHSKSIEKKRE